MVYVHLHRFTGVHPTKSTKAFLTNALCFWNVAITADDENLTGHNPGYRVKGSMARTVIIMKRKWPQEQHVRMLNRVFHLPD